VGSEFQSPALWGTFAISSIRPSGADTVVPRYSGALMNKTAEQSNAAEILAKAGPYPLEAYQFIQDGLRFTVRQVHEQRAEDHGLGGPPATEHVSGQQLCMGLRDFAIDQYGLLARLVLARWCILRTDDFGRMVFAMIAAGALSKTQQDSPEDFRSVFDFAEAFDCEHVAGAIRMPVG